jgi:hypothetical protein
LGCFADRFRINVRREVILAFGLFCRPFQDHGAKRRNPEEQNEVPGVLFSWAVLPTISGSTTAGR